ncbi:MAG: T9SS type A sorting domain-containing protein [Bacteroidota bacterium]|nr:T9SS type A sorting domain-containing protein [Bacteroidota bacterium]
MKKMYLLFICFSLLTPQLQFAQTVNGEIISDQNSLTVLKVWGNHQERGYAYGYLLADKIKDVYEGYLVPQFGNGLANAKLMIQQGQVFNIDQEYITEAQAIFNGITDAGVSISNGDYLDILVANTFLDLMGINENFGSAKLKNGCSSLMTWGDATTGSVDAGKAYVSRHLDWTASPYLTNNQVVLIHLPSENDEQPWIMIGFAGQMSVLSGVNNGGQAAFQHMLSDFNESSVMNMPYTPIWFSLRRALEKYDYNNDGTQNVSDIRSALTASTNGFSDGYIITALAGSNQIYDSLIAMVAEVTPNAPTHVFRYNDYEDQIPGDNLYAANYEIKRNDHHHYCSRYNSIATSFTDSTNISMADNWDKMRLYSNSGSGNIQFMQFCPDYRMLVFAWYHNGQPAYQNNPDTFYLDELFSPPVAIRQPKTYSQKRSMKLRPNPANTEITAEIFLSNNSKLLLEIFDSNFNKIKEIIIPEKGKGLHQFKFSLEGRPAGVYIINISGKGFSISEKFVKY